MITNKGKQILSKYVLGVNPAYATHIAVGCGSDSFGLNVDEPDENFFRNNLVFETSRAPIISRGLIKENGLDKIVFKAELPTENRSSITEIGLFSEQRNVRASQFDSKSISQFNAPTELWYQINGSDSLGPLQIVSRLDKNETGNISPSSSNGASALSACYASTSDPLWTSVDSRKIRKECPRVGNGSIMLQGNYSNLVYNTSTSSWTQTNQYGIETSSIGLNMSKNAPDDEIRIAFSIASTNETDVSSLYGQNIRINIWFEFINHYVNSIKSYAKAKVSIDGDITNTSDYIIGRVDSTRYIVYSFKKSDFVVDNDFSWASINGIRIFASIQKNNAVNQNYWLVLDGIRLENVTTESPTYGMVAYTQVFTLDELPIIKSENTTNYVEFRMLVN